MLEALKDLVARNAKAIVAFAMSLLVALFLHLNLNVSPEVLAALESLLVALLVWLVPNQEA